jgi:hypothetical protein
LAKKIDAVPITRDYIYNRIEHRAGWRRTG